MRKNKTWTVNLFDRSSVLGTSNVGQGQNDEFWTNDTEAYLNFKPNNDSFNFIEAELTMYNKNDGSLVVLDNTDGVEIENNVVSYEMQPEVIAHFGKWTVQVRFIRADSESFTSGTIEFEVKRALGDAIPERLTAMKNWDTFFAHAQETVDLISEAELARQEAEGKREETYEKVKDLPEAFQNVINETTLKDVISAPEIIQARKDEANLNARLDKEYNEVTSQLAQTERVKIGGGVKAEPEDLSERTLGLVTGQGTINIESIPQNKSVTPAKTDFVIESRNLYNKETSVDYKGPSGEDSLERSASDYIPVQGNTTYVPSHNCLVVVYGESFNQIGGTQIKSPTNPLTTVSLARFVKVAPLIVDKDSFQFEEGDVPTTYQDYGLRVPNLLLNGKTLGSDMELSFKEKSINPKHTNFITASTNLLNIDDVSDNTFVDANGNEVAQSGRSATDFIPISGSAISFYGVVRVALYDENKTHLSNIGSGIADEVATRNLTTQTRYIKVVIANAYIDAAQLNVGENLLPYEPFRHLSLESKYLPIEIQSIIDGEIPINENAQPKRPSHLLHWNPPVEETGLIYDLFLSKPDNVLHGTKYAHAPENSRRIWRYKELGNPETYEEGINIKEVGIQGQLVYMHITPHEVVYITRNDVDELGWVYRAKDIFDENPELVLEMTTGAPNWITSSSYYDGITNIILVGEYGSDKDKQPRKFYISTNGGRDFRVLKETTVVKSDRNSHWHAGYYDVYDNRIWLSEGDTENRNVHFTTDFGETWETVDGGKHPNERHQPTLIFGWGERVIFGRDAQYKPMGLDSYERNVTEEERNEPTKLVDKYTVHKNEPASTAYPQLPIGYTTDGEAYVLFSSSDKDIQTIIATGDYGQNWTSVYSAQYSQSRIEHIIGPTNEGYLCSRLRTHPDPSVPVNSLIYSEKPEWS